MSGGIFSTNRGHIGCPEEERKKTKMATDYGKTEVGFTPVPTDEELAERRASYTVPIPDDLTNWFTPSKPVTKEQAIAWDCYNIEPYPGYAEEFTAWDSAWERINRAQAEADGVKLNYIDNMVLQPEFDPQTGELIDYEEPAVLQDTETGKVEVYLPGEEDAKAAAEARGEDTSDIDDEE